MNPRPTAKRLAINRDTVLLITLLLGLMIFTAYSASQQDDGTRYPPGSAHSNQPDGGRALRLWLSELGYKTATLEGGLAWPDKTVDVLLVLSPSEVFNQSEAAAIEKWVEAGGTLIFAGDDAYVAYQLWSRFDLRAEWLESPAEPLFAAQPLLDAPPVSQAGASAEMVWAPDSHDYVTHLATADGKPVLISMRRGQGWVFALTTVEPFTNDGLKDAGNAALAYNLVQAGAGRAGQVSFDEYHHGFQTEPSIRTWLVSSRFGWAILYSALVAFVFLLVGGRRFGAPVPLPEHIARRTTAEYIRALANLSRRAGRRQAVLAHYKDRLKRHLGRAHRLDPGLGDSSFVSELLAYRPDLDKERLARLLAALSRQEVSERDMVRLAEEATCWME